MLYASRAGAGDVRVVQTGHGAPLVAVHPPEPVLDRIAALDRPVAAGVRWTTRDQWHVTLRFMGAVDDALVAALVEAVRSIPSSPGGAAAGVELGPATSCFGRHVLHVPASGLGALAAATVRATAGFGEPPDTRPFAGHLTLARSRPRGPDLRRLAGAPLAASWAATELLLVRSHLGRAGARYEVVHRAPLTSP